MLRFVAHVCIPHSQKEGKGLDLVNMDQRQSLGQGEEFESSKQIADGIINVNTVICSLVSDLYLDS